MDGKKKEGIFWICLIALSVIFIFAVVSNINHAISYPKFPKYRICFDGEKYKIQQTTNWYSWWSDVPQRQTDEFSHKHDPEYFQDEESALLALNRLRAMAQEAEYQRVRALEWKCLDH